MKNQLIATTKDLRIIQYALCFLLSNYSEEEEENLIGVSYKDIEKMATTFVDLYEKQKKI
jgi:hypothetical protein